ncbi:MAG TPA: TadE/TadG family type IV pilus assembly protein [Novosphingobium sp.]
MRKTLAQLLADRSGTSVIELGMVAPVLTLMATGTTDVAMGFAQQLRDQQAADRAIAYAQMATLANISSTQLQAVAASAAGLATGQVTVTLWLECNGLQQSSFTGTCATGSPARYVSEAVNDAYTPTFGVLATTAISLRGFAEGRLQ